MDINVQMTRHGPADPRRSAYEPLLFCLSFILTAAWGIVVLIPIFFMAALADGFDRAWRCLRQPTRDLLGDGIHPLKHMDSP
jgi:hypothetical protein